MPGPSAWPGQRNRPLPPRVVVYFLLAVCFFAGRGYEEVARLLTHGQGWVKHCSGSWRVPTTAMIFRARAKLVLEPLKALFSQVARSWPSPARARSADTDRQRQELTASGLVRATGLVALAGQRDH